MTTPDHPTSNRLHGLKGTVKRALGWLTADRKMEAEGAAEERLEETPSESEVRSEKRHLKDEYGETAASSDPSPER